MGNEFVKTDWEYERSSGYAGARNKNTGEWVHLYDYNLRLKKSEELQPQSADAAENKVMIEIIEWIAINYQPIISKDNSSVMWNLDDANALYTTEEAIQDFKEHNSDETIPDKDEEINWKAKVEFYRQETEKIRNYIFSSNIGKPNQKIFEAIYDHIVSKEKEINRLKEALEKIAKWELPATGKFWDEEKTRPTSYETEYGNNGSREYIRNIAKQALQSK